MKNYTLLIKLILGIVIVLLLVGSIFKISNLNKEIKTYDNNFKALNLELDKSKEDAMALVGNANKRIDSAASKGVIKANTRDRYKTRLNKIVNSK